MKHPRYDVAILGTGLGGTILGAILARHGLRVLLLEEQIHPRFAIGESTVPETTMCFRLLAARYGVPEIAYLSTYQLLSRHVGTTHGVKRNFSFVWHRPGEHQNPHESTQFPTAAPPLGPDVHFFRQDTDARMLAVAMSYGCTLSQRTRIEQVEISDSGVRLASADGREFHASYVVDAGGLKSMLAHQFGLRTPPDAIKTRSRSIYTHMVGVRPYDAIGGGPAAHDLPSPLSQGTLHHLFDGGWIWVIPFNNHPISTNPLISVGLQLDIDKFPKDGTPPEEEFWKVVNRFPDMKRQLEAARPVRDWVATDRLQFTSTRAVGDRFCMLPHAFRFIDPLFSSGLTVTMLAINSIAIRLIRARTDGDWSSERFAPVDTWMKYNFNYYDRLVAGSYASWKSFPLWNAWTRLWMIGGLLGAFGVNELIAQAQKSRDPLNAPASETYPFRGVQGSELEPNAALMDRCEPVMDEVRAGRKDPEEASAEIFDNIRASGMWPTPWGKLDPRVRHTGTFTMVKLLRSACWLRYFGPEATRKYYYVTPRAIDNVVAMGKDLSAEVTRSVRAVTRLTRDYIFDANEDWRLSPCNGEQQSSESPPMAADISTPPGTPRS